MPGVESTIDVESVFGQKKPVRLLTTLLLNETIPHAFLFFGPEGVGKKAAATAFAMACNCMARGERTRDTKIRFDPYSIPDQIAEKRPCGDCKSCRKIESGSHPDIILIQPSGSFIRIDQIRHLCSTLAMKPYEARLRVVIISDAQTMNASSGNALLKVLEEPPDKTIIILTATRVSDLLPTIVSRCRHIRFNPIPRRRIETVLIENGGTDGDDAEKIAIMANGSVSKALSIANPKNKINWINRRTWLIYEVQSLPTRPIPSRLAFAAILSKNKDALADSLKVIEFWFRDLVVYKYNSERIINTDLRKKIQQASQQMSVVSLLTKIKNIHSARKNIQANTNLRLTLEVLIMQLSKV